MPPPAANALLNDRRGVAAITTALGLSAVVGVLALALDAAAAFRLQARLQAVADAAALAAARGLGSADNPGARAAALVAANLDPAEARLRLAVRREQIRVELRAIRPPLLGRIAGPGAWQIAASATARVEDLGAACLVALGTDPVGGAHRARRNRCTLVSAAQGLSPSERAAANPFPAADTNPGRCRPGTHIVSGHERFGPGSELPARCDGVRVPAGSRLELQGGAFAMPGPLTVEAGGALVTREATLLSGAHAIDFQPGAQVDMSPQLSGRLVGILLLGGPAGGAPIRSRLLAGSGQRLAGAVVLAGQAVDIGGNSAPCGMVVADSVRIRAPTQLGLDCGRWRLSSIHLRRVRLVG